MRNIDAFEKAFGTEETKRFMDLAQDAQIFRWLMEERKEEVKKFEVVIPRKEEKVERPKKELKKGRKGFDYSWHQAMIEDFYLSGERTKGFKPKDDESPLGTPKSVSGLKVRFEKGLELSGLKGTIVVRRYYQGTTQECVMLENLEAERNPVITYAYS